MAQLITIVHYNPDWPRWFVCEKRRLMAVLGNRVLAIEHIGSTAIPEMDAKAIIDIMAAVRSLQVALNWVAELEHIGYEPRPDLGHLLPNRLFFEKGPPEARQFHLHLLEQGSELWENHLECRDYLRGHADQAAAYGRLKRRLASELGHDRHAYSTAKRDFVEGIVRLARLARDLDDSSRGESSFSRNLRSG
jgi:GrpB-like predicted nucleotidyltransferase (UPF0157 family)